MVCLKKIIGFSLITLNGLLLAAQPKVVIKNYNVNVPISLPSLNEMAHDILAMAKKDYQISTNWFENHPKTVIGLTLGSVYFFINSYLVRGRFIMQDANSWSNWKNDTNLSDLLNKPTNQLCRELYQSILDKYNNNNQSDLINPLVCFSRDLEQELANLKAFCKIGNVLHNSKINFLFLITAHNLEQANDKINRLTYFKKVITESLQISLNN